MHVVERAWEQSCPAPTELLPSPPAYPVVLSFLPAPTFYSFIFLILNYMLPILFHPSSILETILPLVKVLSSVQTHCHIKVEVLHRSSYDRGLRVTKKRSVLH